MLECHNVMVAQGGFQLRANCHFQSGQIAALIGPSGSGKSTFLSVLAGFLQPKAGSLSWNGTDFTHLAPGKRPTSMLFQDNNLFPHLTVAQNVALGLRGKLNLSKPEWQSVSQAISHVGLEGYETRRPHTLSGGQQSRAALARVLLGKRPIVLLDEPFAALGPALKKEMLDLVHATLARAGQTVLMVTHDPEDAKRIADTISLVAEGQIAEPTSTKDLFNNPPPALRAYL